MRTLIILLLTGLTGCHSTAKKSGQVTNADTSQVSKTSDTLPRSSELYKSTPEELKAFREEEIIDSLTSLRTLNLALNIADKQTSKDTFSLNSDSLEINFGNIFSLTAKHLFIKRIFPWGVFADIYKLQGKEFKKVCSKDMAPLAYAGDTIQDVNGDNRLDYLFHWYPMSGCCERDIFDVYLQKANGDFANEMEFINPTFASKEKIVRGMCYGYGAPLYKYKWNGFTVDTIEYIYFPDSTNGNHYLRRKHEDENEKGEIINGLPDEYKKIGYDND